MIEVLECQGVVAQYEQLEYVKRMKGIPKVAMWSTQSIAMSLPSIVFLPPGSLTRPPCLNTITCGKCGCLEKGFGSYDPLTRDIFLCADRLNKAIIYSVLRHELAHAESLCGVPLPPFDCTACMKEEKTASARTLCGPGISDKKCNEIVTELAHGSCYWFPCFSSKWQDYLDVPYDKNLPPIPRPPNPHPHIF